MGTTSPITQVADHLEVVICTNVPGISSNPVMRPPPVANVSLLLYSYYTLPVLTNHLQHQFKPSSHPTTSQGFSIRTIPSVSPFLLTIVLAFIPSF